MTTVLIAGGGGYIGSVLAEMLVQEGHRVTILDRFFFGHDLLKPILGLDGLTTIREDIRFAKPEAFEGVEIVVDLSGISNDPSCDLEPAVTQGINLDGTLHIAKLAKDADVKRFLFSSSCSIYGRAASDVLDENSPKHPVSLYAQTKIQAEEKLLELSDDNFSVTFLRNATAFGLSYRMRFDLVINIMTLYAYRQGKIFVLGGGRQWRPLVHVRDISKAFILAMDAPREKVHNEAFNVGSNEQNYQVVQIAHMVKDVIPYIEIEMVPDDPDKRSYNVNCDKIHDVLGFQPQITPYEGIVEIKQALERGKVDDHPYTKTVAYYKFLLEAERVVKEVSYNGRIF